MRTFLMGILASASADFGGQEGGVADLDLDAFSQLEAEEAALGEEIVRFTPTSCPAYGPELLPEGAPLSNPSDYTLLLEATKVGSNPSPIQPAFIFAEPPPPPTPHPQVIKSVNDSIRWFPPGKLIPEDSLGGEFRPEFCSIADLMVVARDVDCDPVQSPNLHLCGGVTCVPLEHETRTVWQIMAEHNAARADKGPALMVYIHNVFICDILQGYGDAAVDFRYMFFGMESDNWGTFAGPIAGRTSGWNSNILGATCPTPDGGAASATATATASGKKTQTPRAELLQALLADDKFVAYFCTQVLVTTVLLL
jgi:hypothetical protein